MTMLPAMLFVAAFGAVATVEATAQEAAPTFQQVVDGAKREGELILLTTYPTQDKNKQKLIAAFNARFGLNLKISWVPTQPNVMISRLVSEGASGRFSGDVASAAADDIW